MMIFATQHFTLRLKEKVPASKKSFAGIGNRQLLLAIERNRIGWKLLDYWNLPFF